MNMLDAVHTFVQVVDQGSFTRAANALHSNRPSVTKAVQRLELELGIRLLHRTTRKLSLTAEGEEFYERCQHLLREVADTFDLFSPTRPAKGRLRIDLPSALAKSIIIPSLPVFRRDYPCIDIILRCSDRPVDLVEEGADCAVRLGQLEDSSLVARRIGAIPMVTCAAPAYLSDHGTPENLDDLGWHSAVNFLVKEGRATLEWKFDCRNGAESVKVRSGIEVDDSEAFLACGLAGSGLLQGLRPALQPYIDVGQLVEVLSSFKTIPKPVSVLVTNRRYTPSKVSAFVSWLEQVLRDRGLS